MNRTDILEKARSIVTGEREITHGKPEHSFERIAQYWSVFLDKKLTGYDVARMLLLFKEARSECGTGCFDSFVDICGYASIAGELYGLEEVRKLNE